MESVNTILRWFVAIGVLFFAFDNCAATSYSFDAAGRLLSVARDDGSFVSFEYDAVGNLARKASGRPGTHPIATVSPNPLKFGSVTIGSTTSQAITVTNVGPGNLTVSQVNVSGAAFSIASNACTTLTPTNNCAVTVQFAPTATGAVTGTVTITSNATASPQSVTLNGTGTAGTDVTPPTTPTTLTATSPTASTAALNWSASTDSGGSGLAGYKVERCAGSGCSNFAQIATPATNSFGDTGLAASKIYGYRVRAYDNAGNVSAYSNVATITTLGAAVNGTCGSANLGTFATAPSGAALCSAGTSSIVAGTGPWSWTCQGLNGGSDASCSAQSLPNTCVLDLDGDGSVSALTDGLMLVRILRGATGSAITAGVMGTGPLARPTSAAIAAFVQAMRDSMALDVDGNGVVELADALIIQRAMLGMNGESVLNGAGQTGSPARSTWLAVRDYLVQSCGMTGLSTSAGTGATGRLNDTGITFSGNYPSGNNAGCSGSNNLAAQDCSQGRDASGLTNNDADGRAGFSFTKISNSGSVLAASAALGIGSGDWACTRDNVTGLLWEVKTSNGLRSMNQTYSWYSSDATNNAGSVGTASGGVCQTAGRCDTEKFVQDVNAAGLCGRSDWRMPHVKELEGIADSSRFNPAIDPTYFPNTTSDFWSGSPFADDPTVAWYVYFSFGGGAYHRGPRNGAFPVRLVRTGQ